MASAKCRGTVQLVAGGKVVIQIYSGPEALQGNPLTTTMSQARRATMTGKRRGTLTWGDGNVETPFVGEEVVCQVSCKGSEAIICVWAPESAITRVTKRSKSEGRKGGNERSHRAAGRRRRLAHDMAS